MSFIKAYLLWLFTVEQPRHINLAYENPNYENPNYENPNYESDSENPTTAEIQASKIPISWIRCQFKTKLSLFVVVVVNLFQNLRMWVLMRKAPTIPRRQKSRSWMKPLPSLHKARQVHQVHQALKAIQVRFGHTIRKSLILWLLMTSVHLRRNLLSSHRPGRDPRCHVYSNQSEPHSV